MNWDFVVNDTNKRFELKVDDSVAFIDYILNQEGQIFLTHTEVPSELGGKGVGKELVKKSFEFIEEKGYKLAPLCPFVAAYVKKNPEWARILSAGFSV